MTTLPLTHDPVCAPDDWRYRVIFAISEFARLRNATDLKFHFSSEDSEGEGSANLLYVSADFTGGNCLRFNTPAGALEAKLRFLGSQLFANTHTNSFILTSGDVLVSVSRTGYEVRNLPTQQESTIISLTLEGVESGIDNEQTWQHLATSFAQYTDRSSSGLRIHTDLDPVDLYTRRCLNTVYGKLWFDADPVLPVRIISRVNGIPHSGMSIFGVKPNESVAVLDATNVKNVNKADALVEHLTASPLTFKCIAPTSTIVANDSVYSAWVAHAQRLLTGGQRPDLGPIGIDALVNEVFPGNSTSKVTTEHYPANFVISDYTNMPRKALVARLKAEKTALIADTWVNAVERVLSSDCASKLGFSYQAKSKTKWMYNKRPVFCGFAVTDKKVAVHTSTQHGCFVYRINPVTAGSRNLIFDAALAIAQPLSRDPLEVASLASRLARSAHKVIE